MGRPGEPTQSASAESAPSTPEQRLSAYGASGWNIAWLSLVILVLWTIGTDLLRGRVPQESPLVAIAARVLFWLLPALVYLVRAHGSRWWVPLGLHFPYGQRQVVLSVVVPLIVTFILLLGTATQMRVPLGELWNALVDQARPRLVAPLFEELVFRGVITAEALTIARLGAGDADHLRRRYWAAQLWAAIVFTLVHWPSWLQAGGMAQALAQSFPVLVTGLVLGFVFAQTRSIYVVVFLHWLNNELSRLTF